jgi:hypothetical protein
MTSPRFPVHTLESAPVATRPVLEGLAQRSLIPGQPINLHAQMAHSPSVLLSYMAMRQTYASPRFKAYMSSGARAVRTF